MDVWPASCAAVNVFEAMTSQWRTGFNGPTGLDYGVLPKVMRLVGIPKPDRREVFGQVRVMEFEALKVMQAERAKAQ